MVHHNKIFWQHRLSTLPRQYSSWNITLFKRRRNIKWDFFSQKAHDWRTNIHAPSGQSGAIEASTTTSDIRWYAEREKGGCKQKEDKTIKWNDLPFPMVFYLLQKNFQLRPSRIKYARQPEKVGGGEGEGEGEEGGREEGRRREWV